MSTGLDVSVEEKARMLEAVGRTLRRESFVLEYLESDLNDVVKSLKPFYPQASDDLLREKAQEVLDQKDRFVAPASTIDTKLATLYINRAKAYVVGAIGIAAALAVGTIKYVANAAHEASLNHAERAVEERIEEGYQHRQNLGVEIQKLDPQSLTDAETRLFTAHQRAAIARLQEADAFYNTFIEKGQADEKVTRENYPAVKDQYAAVEGVVAKAGEEVSQAQQLNARARELATIRTTLDTVLAEITNFKAPKPIAGRAETIYHNGIASVEGRNLPQANQYAQELSGLKRDAADFNTLSATVEQQYQSITRIAKEDAAKTKAQELYAQAQGEIETAEVPRLRQTATELTDLNTILNQEYKIIVDGCFERFPDGSRNPKYYVRVRAEMPNGQNATVTVVDEEQDHKKFNVTMWGEGIPNEGVFNHYYEDKMGPNGQGGDNIMDDNLYGEKKKGFLEPTLKYPKAGQVTRW